MSGWPFNADLPKNQWTEIIADGFPQAALAASMAVTGWRSPEKRWIIRGGRLVHFADLHDFNAVCLVIHAC